MAVIESSIVAQYGGSIKIPLFISPTKTRKNANLIPSSFWTTYADPTFANNAWTCDRPVGPLTWHSDSANGPPSGSPAQYQCSFADWLFWLQSPGGSLFWGPSIVGANITPTLPSNAGVAALAVAGSTQDFANFQAPLSVVSYLHKPWVASIMQCSNPHGGNQNALQYSLFNIPLPTGFVLSQAGFQGVIFNSGAVSNPVTVDCVVPDFKNDVNYIISRPANLYPTDIFTIVKSSVNSINGQVFHGSFDDASLNNVGGVDSVGTFTAFRDGYIWRAYNANGGRTLLMKKDGSVYMDLLLMPQDATAAGIVNYYQAHYNLTLPQLSIDAGDGFAYLMDAQTNGTGNPNAILTSFGLNLTLNPVILPGLDFSMPLPCMPWGC